MPSIPPRHAVARRAAALALGLATCLTPASCDRFKGGARPAPEQSQASKGAELYGKYCVLCHGADAKGYAADHAPSLVSAPFLASASNTFIARAIRNGRPGTAMGAYGKSRGGPLEESDIEAILDFLRWPGPSWVVPPTTLVAGDATRGQAIFEETCQPCHGSRDARGEAVHLANPEFIGSASDAFLRYAVVHGRPGTPMVSFAGKLEEQQIDDVVAFVRSFADPKPYVPPPVPGIPADLPIVMNPNGKTPSFTLREDRFVSAEQVKKAIDAKNRVVIVDARAPSEWIQLHIPGSVPAPYHDLSRLDVVPKDGTWIVAYCACPHHASGMVVDELRNRGYKRTAILDEGILFWNQHGYPVEGASVTSGANKGWARGPTGPTPPSMRSLTAAPLGGHH